MKRAPLQQKAPSLLPRQGARGTARCGELEQGWPHPCACRDASPAISNLYFPSELNEQRAGPETGRIIRSTKTQKICSTSAKD